MSTEFTITNEAKIELTSEELAFFRKQLNDYKPYNDDDPALDLWDNPNIEEGRLKARNAKILLTGLGYDISDIMKKWE